MKLSTINTALAAASVAAAAILATAPIALADDSGVTTSALGSQAKLDTNNVIQGWTVSDLKPSTDTIPYPVRGTLWEVTATSEALQGSVTPIVSNFNVRAADGQNYRALFQVATPQGVNPSTLGQGQTTSGKVYFDVTGDKPTTVVYNSGGHDLLVWDAPAPAAVPVSSGNQTYSEATPAVAAAPAATPATAVPAATPGTPDAPAATPAGAGRAADLPAAEAAPLADPEATPVAPDAPAAAGTEGAPVPASNGTLLPAEGTAPAAAGAGSAATAIPPSELAPVPAGTETVPAGNPTPADPALVPAATQPTTTVPVAPVSNPAPAS